MEKWRLIQSQASYHIAMETECKIFSSFLIAFIQVEFEGSWAQWHIQERKSLFSATQGGGGGGHSTLPLTQQEEGKTEKWNRVKLAEGERVN